MTPRADVVVVGGRAAGAATALQLARQGVGVVVLDRERYGSDTISTHALMRTGVLQLQRWQLLDQLHRAGVPPIRSTVFHYASDDVRVELRPTAGVEALYAPRRTTLDRLLVDAARDAGAEVRHGVTVTGLRRDRRGRVTGVQAEGRDGAAFELSARLTVGADGLRSSVARWVDAPFERRSRTSSAVLYGYVAGLATGGYEWAYGGRASAGFIPTEDGLVCVFAATDAARFRTLQGPATNRFRQLLTESSPALAQRVDEARLVGRLRGFGGSPAYLRVPTGPGWALVGDAGYFKDPLSTHGISDALRDAELLARAITSSLSGAPDALDDYRRERDRLSAELFDVTERIAGHRWSEEELRGLLRGLSRAMTDEIDTLLALDGPGPAAVA